MSQRFLRHQAWSLHLDYQNTIVTAVNHIVEFIIPKKKKKTVPVASILVISFRIGKDSIPFLTFIGLLLRLRSSIFDAESECTDR